MRGNKVTVSVLLPEAINEKLKTLAAANGRTKSAYIRQILRRYLRYLEAESGTERAEMDWEVR